MRFPPFYFWHDREHNHGDRSLTTTIRLTAFYRSIELSYTRPDRRRP